TAEDQYGPGTTVTTTVNGVTWEWTTSGTQQYTYETTGGYIVNHAGVPNGTQTTKRNGEVLSSRALPPPLLQPERYVCSGDTMNITGESYVQDYRRVSHTT